MKALKKIFAGVLILSLIGLNLPQSVVCAGTPLFAKTDKATITRHEIKILSTPEEDIPVVRAEEGEKKGISNWLWVGLGVLLVGGIAALAGGGGGGGGDDTPNPTTGDVSVSW